MSKKKNEHQRHTAFLKQAIAYGDTPEHKDLEERIARAQRDEHSVRRAVWLMVLLLAFCLAGLCYVVLFSSDIPQTMTQLATPVIIRIILAVGLGTMICLLTFLGLRV